MALGAWRKGSIAVNAYYLIGEWDARCGCRFRSTQIKNLNRRDPAPGSEPGIRGKIFHEYSLPSRDPRGANKPYFCFDGRTASLRTTDPKKVEKSILIFAFFFRKKKGKNQNRVFRPFWGRRCWQPVSISFFFIYTAVPFWGKTFFIG
jgi:hypothetical protein